MFLEGVGGSRGVMKSIDRLRTVFLYMDYRDFLKEWYAEAKKKHPSFSLRSFAKRAGFRSHNTLKLVMQGKRNLSTGSARQFVKGLKLERREGEYFETLVAYNQATDPEERQKFYERLLQQQEFSHVRTLLQDQYEYYSSWYHTAVRELVSHPDFKEDPLWISRHLSPNISPEEARQSLELLERLGLIAQAKGGRLHQTDKLLSTGPEVHSHTVAQYHRSVLDLAKSAIDRFPRDNRDISSLTLGISRAMLPVLKRRIQLFREEVMRLISTDQRTESVIQFNLQLFPLTTLETGGGRRV